MNPSGVFLNGPFRDGEAEFEEFPPDAFSTPQTIFCGHALNQDDGLGGQCGTTAAVTRPALAEQSKALAMPAQEGVGFEDQKGYFKS